MDTKATGETLTLTETAQALGVSRPFVKKLVERGELSAYQSALDRRAKFIKTSDVRALQRRCLTPLVVDEPQSRVPA